VSQINPNSLGFSVKVNLTGEKGKAMKRTEFSDYRVPM
jgi:hypothetical protein